MDLVEHLKLSYNLSLLEESKLPPEIHDHTQLEGMSSPKVRHFLNNLGSLPGVKYLEIGTYKGSTLISAVHGNEGDFFAIDNFTWGYRDEFLQNLSTHGVREKIKFFDKNSWELDLAEIDKKINVYFYDGDHSTKSQAKALTYFRPVLADEFIYIVDDWRDSGDDKQSGAMSGTWKGIEDADLEIVYESEAPRTTNMPPGFEGQQGYHMGLGLFVLKKKKA